MTDSKSLITMLMTVGCAIAMLTFAAIFLSSGTEPVKPVIDPIAEKLQELADALKGAEAARQALNEAAETEFNRRAVEAAKWLRENAPEIRARFLDECVIEWCATNGSEFPVCEEKGE